MSNIANLLSTNSENMKKSFQAKQENFKLDRLRKLKDYVDSKENDRTYTRKYMYRRNKPTDTSLTDKSDIVIDYEYVESDYPRLSDKSQVINQTSVQEPLVIPTNKINYSILISTLDSKSIDDKKLTLRSVNRSSLPKLEINKPITLNPFNTDINKFETKTNIIFSKQEITPIEEDTEWKVVSKKKKNITSLNKWF